LGIFIRRSANNNNFSGSLKTLENCKYLERIDIVNQLNIKEGLEYLPAEKLTFFACEGTVFQEILKPYDYDVYAWQLVNVPNKFNHEHLIQKIIDTKKKLEKTDLEENKKNRLESKLQKLVKKLIDENIELLDIIGFFDLKEQIIKVTQEHQASQNESQELKNQVGDLQTEKNVLTIQLAEQEELLSAFQEQVLEAEEIAEKYNELELNYQIEMQNFKVANNTLRSYFAKEIEDLKQKLQVSRKQKDEN
jgi:hypothetical protein